MDRQQLIVEINAAEAAAKQREALHVAELARKQNEAFEIQMDLRRKTAEADVYIQTIAELAEKLKAE